MKIKLMFLCVFAFALTLNGFSQLKVNSSGRVGLGGLDPDATYKLNLYSAIFTTGGGYPDLILGPNPSGTQTRAIYPSTTENGSIGWSTKKFSYVYAKYIYQNGSLVTSYQRLKENFRTIEKPLKNFYK